MHDVAVSLLDQSWISPGSQLDTGTAQWMPTRTPGPVWREPRCVSETQKRMLRRTRWMAAAPLTSAFTIVGGDSALAASGWTPVSVPATGNNVGLHGVSRAPTPMRGRSGSSRGRGPATGAPAIYHWNGTAWSLVSVRRWRSRMVSGGWLKVAAI